MLRRARHGKRCILIWPTMPCGEKLTGSVFDRVLAFGETRVVALEVRYKPAEAYRHPPGERFGHFGKFTHERTGRSWAYHSNETFIVLTKPMPRHRLRLLAVYDMATILEPLGSPQPLKIAT
jgi:hypothetical protein